MNSFQDEVSHRISMNRVNAALKSDADAFMKSSLRAQYSYNFRWLGRPVIQYPQDILAMQELIWEVKPDLVVETGIAHGGSLIFSASMLELNAACGGPPGASVLGIDVDIRPHNRQAIENHPLAKRIVMLQGSSTSPDIIASVKDLAAGKQRILVCLDSNHTHQHVMNELEAYAPLTSVGSYCVVFDTIVEATAECCPSDRPWGLGNNPLTAVQAFLARHPEFVVDQDMDDKLLISVAPSGYLRRIG